MGPGPVNPLRTLLLTALAALGLAATSAAGPLSERIFFVSSPQGIPKIYVVRPDGKDLRRLTRELGPEFEPAVSPAAGLVAYRGGDRFEEDLYAIDLDGRNQRRLTDSPSHDRHPSFSPDGKTLVFSTNRWGMFELALLDLVSGEVRRLTYDQSGNTEPVWSPRGDWIAFVTYRHGNADLYLIDPEGISLRRLTLDPSPQVTPSWSPDGAKIAYQTLTGPRARPSLGMFDLAADRPEPLALPVEDPHFPAWSPDGATLIFTTGLPGQQQLQMLDLATGELSVFGLRGHLPPVDPVWTDAPYPWNPATVPEWRSPPPGESAP